MTTTEPPPLSKTENSTSYLSPPMIKSEPKMLEQATPMMFGEEHPPINAPETTSMAAKEAVTVITISTLS